MLPLPSSPPRRGGLDSPTIVFVTREYKNKNKRIDGCGKGGGVGYIVSVRVSIQDGSLKAEIHRE